MDLNRDTICKIEEMTKVEAIVDEFGRQWHTKALYAVNAPVYPAISVDTLSGFVDAVLEIVRKEHIYVIVNNPFNVACYNKGETGVRRIREFYAEARYEVNGAFPFSRFLTIEDFIINLQVYFQQDEMTGAILKLVSNISDNLVKKYEDDGVSQAVMVQTSLTHKEMVEVPRRVELVPWRTFRDVEQPKTKFIFRMQGQKEEPPLCALFDLAGDLWKIAAVQAIKQYLQKELPEVLVIA